MQFLKTETLPDTQGFESSKCGLPETLVERWVWSQMSSHPSGQFPRAPTADDFKLVPDNFRSVFSQLWRRSPKSRAPQSHAPSEGSRGGSSRLLQLLVAPGVLWLVATSDLCPCGHIAFSSATSIISFCLPLSFRHL